MSTQERLQNHALEVGQIESILYHLETKGMFLDMESEQKKMTFLTFTLVRSLIEGKPGFELKTFHDYADNHHLTGGLQ